MKRAFAAAAVLLALLALSALSCAVFAAGEDDELLIDDMSDVSEWSSVSGDASLVRYGSETETFSSGDDDEGYIAVRRFDTPTGEPLEISRSFSEAVDLYEWDSVGFYINITDAGVPGAVYTVTVTLYTRGPAYSVSGEVGAGGWVRYTADIGGYSLRTDVVGISVSVSAAVPDGAEKLRLSYRVDAMYAVGKRDTAHEARFLADSFEARGGVLERGDDGAYSVVAAGGRARITGRPVIRHRQDGGDDLFRFTLTTDAPADVTLNVTYLDGTEAEAADPVRVTGGGVMTAVYFDIEDIDLVLSFTLTAEGEGTCALRLYGASVVDLPEGEAAGIGTLEVCRAVPGGGVNLRGTVPPASVADYIDGEIGIFCVPLYADVENYIKDADPVATLDVSTRFDVTVGASSLPTGYIAMRFVAAVCRGDERIIIATPKLPTFSDEIGAALPARRAGIKGLASDDAGTCAEAGAAVVIVDADLDELYGTASSGRLYSYGGRISYFDNSAISALDDVIKTSSLTGAACFLHLRYSSPRGGYRAVTVNDADEFAYLAAAVSYLTQRYSSTDYGFLSGIILGDSVYTDKSTGGAEARAEAAARALAVTYQIGRSRIAGFRVMVPIGGKLADYTSSFDAATLLRRLSDAVEPYGIGYGVYMRSGEPLALADAVGAFAETLGGRAPTCFFAEYAPGSASRSPELLREFSRRYRLAASGGVLSGFILDMPVGGDGDFLDMFYLLDTNEHARADKYAGTEGDVSDLSYPVSLTRGGASAAEARLAGTYTLFDFTDSYNTAGWFPVAGGGECVTVGALGRRMLRASGGVGAMWSSASSPRDLTACPHVLFEASSPDSGVFTFTVYSEDGIFTSPLSLVGGDRTFDIDLTDFPGVASVTGFAVTGGDGAEIRIRRLSLGSETLGGDELALLFTSPEGGEGGDIERDSGALSVTALALASLAFGAASFGIIRSRSRGGKRQISEEKL